MLRWALLGLLLAVTGPDAQAAAPKGKILKVLPHLLDLQGRNSLSPSLYERDAYQLELKKHPEKCSALRFDVQWKASNTGAAALRLFVEVRGSKEPKPVVLVQGVERRRWYQRWTQITLDGEAYRKLGEVVAWRASLWDGDTLLAEQKSFLW
jgi:hypothetical protein